MSDFSMSQRTKFSMNVTNATRDFKASLNESRTKKSVKITPVVKHVMVTIKQGETSGPSLKDVLNGSLY